MIKAIFFDIDNTLLSHKTNKIPESTIKALELLKAKGIKLFIATGRHFIEMAAIDIYQYNFDGYVLLTGQIVCDQNLNIIKDFPINNHDKKIVLELFNKKDYPIILVEKDRLYINYLNDKVSVAQKSLDIADPEVSTYSGNTIYQITPFIDINEEQDFLKDFRGCECSRWHEYSIDMVDKSGGKLHGVEAMIRYHHLDKAEVMAIGDGENDIEMLKNVGISIAMGNASPKVKAIVDYVTDDIDNDGIYKALKHFNLI